MNAKYRVISIVVVLMSILASGKVKSQSITIDLWELESIKFNTLTFMEFSNSQGRYIETEKKGGCTALFDFENSGFKNAFKANLKIIECGEYSGDEMSLTVINNSKNIWDFEEYTRLIFNAYDYLGATTWFEIYFYSDEDVSLILYTDMNDGICDSKLILTNE